MTDFGESRMNFTYTGFGRHINISLDGEEADYLPKVMATFAEFCRSVGFVWVKVDQTEADGEKGYKVKNYLFTGNYKWDEDTTWAETSPPDSSWWDIVDDEQPEEVNQAASDYWDDLVDEAVAQSEPVEAGDTVFYHGRGAGETTLNELEQPQGHGGHKGVSLVNMKGTVVMVTSSPVGPRVLVKWNNWNDGHNGMGDDPNAVMSAKNYWWSNVDNVSKSN